MRVRIEVDIPGNTLTEAIEYAFADPTVLTDGATWVDVDSLTVDRQQAQQEAVRALLDLQYGIRNAESSIAAWLDVCLAQTEKELQS